MCNLNYLQELFDAIEERKTWDKDQSYTAKLFHKGTRKIAQKVGEEATEVAIAAVSEGKKELKSESADLLYHLMVLWSEQGISLEDIAAELKERRGQSGLDEKKSRKG